MHGHVVATRRDLEEGFPFFGVHLDGGLRAAVLQGLQRVVAATFGMLCEHVAIDKAVDDGDATSPSLHLDDDVDRPALALGQSCSPGAPRPVDLGELHGYRIGSLGLGALALGALALRALVATARSRTGERRGNENSQEELARHRAVALYFRSSLSNGSA